MTATTVLDPESPCAAQRPDRPSRSTSNVRRTATRRSRLRGARTSSGIENLDFYYSRFRAVKGINIAFEARKITALIGPSGCGKSTLLRTINRMNDLITGHPRRGQGALPRRGPVREGR